MDNKPERKSPLIDWLMGVEQNSVYLSIILVVSCAGGCDCEELVGNQIEHLGRNDTNYFMYLWEESVCSSSELLHINKASGARLYRGWCHLKED